MTYEAELSFLKSILKKARVHMTTIDPAEECDTSVDLQLRKMLGMEELYGVNFYDEFRAAKNNILYRMTDAFFCSYIFFILPGNKKKTVAVIGPYMSADLTHEQLLEQAEKFNVPTSLFKAFENYYASISINTEDSVFNAAIAAFAERIWGGEDEYELVDINQKSTAESTVPYDWDDRRMFDETDWNMRAVEARYSHENEMIQAVTMGEIHKMESLMSGFGKLSFERRNSDPVRNLKNYCIIMNTLLRKAVEAGGVHPLYIDRISSDFANRIEMLASTDAVSQLMTDMYTDYCKLVRRHSTGEYSPTIQKTIMHINFGLGGDLSLHTLANAQNINASYLSSLFKKETGSTITDYVSKKRVHRAERLLVTTKLQIQTVAQYCGISDVNYFSKIFKKYTGKTPKEYRKDVAVNK